jgi:hypothetical protein
MSTGTQATSLPNPSIHCEGVPRREEPFSWSCQRRKTMIGRVLIRGLVATGVVVMVVAVAKAGIEYYIVSYEQDQNGRTISGSITTDGSIGMIQSIESWNYSVDYGGTRITAASTDPGAWGGADGAWATEDAILIGPYASLLSLQSGGNCLTWENNGGYDKLYSGPGWDNSSPSMGGTNPWIIALRPHVIDGVPEYLWNYGCAPTSAGIVAAYWDRNGFPDLMPGKVAPLTSGEGSIALHPRNVTADGYEANYGDPDVNLMIATVGHHRDYWAHGLGVGEGANNDPMLDHHTADCIADFIGTSRGPAANGGTGTSFAALTSLGFPSLVDWAKTLGYKSKFAVTNIGEFGFIKSEIDAGRPVLVDWPNHTTVCYGYMDGGADDKWLAIRDTWCDGNSNTNTIQYEKDKYAVIEAKTTGDIEWWKYRDNKSTGYVWVTDVAAWWPTGANSAGITTSLGDSFSLDSHGGDGSALNYAVSSASGGGIAQIVSSPLNDSNDVLKLSNPQPGDYVAIERGISVADIVRVEFQYLFDTEGKIEVKLDNKNIAEISCPLSGPGSIHSSSFATFMEQFSLVDLGLSEDEIYSLRIELSAPGDPICYFDNLVVANAVPEPTSLALIITSIISLLSYAWRRRQRAE